MARTLPLLGQGRMEELEAAWKQQQPDWARERLLVLRMVGRHRHSALEIGQVVGISRGTVFNYLKAYLAGGLSGLLTRDFHGGKKPLLNQKLQAGFIEQLRQGKFRRAKEAQNWVREQTGQQLALTTLYYWLGKVGGVLKVPRKTHVKKDAALALAFRQQAAEKLAGLVGESRGPVRIWVADEHRYGLLPVIRRCWSLRGVRVLAPYQTRYQWGYLYEALEVDGQNRAELFFAPCVGKDISRLFLEQISASDPAATHVVIWDQAGFHPRDGEEGLPGNVRLLSLPAYSPELNPVERLGDMVKDAICNKLFDSLEQLEEAILGELQAVARGGQAVASLLTNSYLVDQANASARD